MANDVRIGTAPDSWGVWFPDDPTQPPYGRFLDEVAEAGYSWVELGSFGYLPTDAEQLRDELGRRDLRVSGGTTFARLQHPGTLEAVWEQVSPVAALTAAMGAEHLVVIPDLWRDDLTGAAKEPRELTAEQWDALTTNHDALGRRLLEEHGVRTDFHSHADSHVGYQADIERFLEATDPAYVNLCLDTGHVAYFGGDSVDLITRYPERIGYLHLKQVDAGLAARGLAEDISFSRLVRDGVMVEPPSGTPDLAQVLRAARELPQDLFAVVEQDMYPLPDLGAPLPVARRTYAYLAGCR